MMSHLLPKTKNVFCLFVCVFFLLLFFFFLSILALKTLKYTFSQLNKSSWYYLYFTFDRKKNSLFNFFIFKRLQKIKKFQRKTGINSVEKIIFKIESQNNFYLREIQ